MTVGAEALVYVCCFCGGMIAPESHARWTLSLQRDPDDGSQDLFVHRGCLRARVHPSVPLLSDG